MVSAATSAGPAHEQQTQRWAAPVHDLSPHTHQREGVYTHMHTHTSLLTENTELREVRSLAQHTQLPSSRAGCTEQWPGRDQPCMEGELDRELPVTQNAELSTHRRAQPPGPRSHRALLMAACTLLTHTPVWPTPCTRPGACAYRVPGCTLPLPCPCTPGPSPEPFPHTRASLSFSGERFSHLKGP